MECRRGCGACCIAISISSPLPGMPEGKPAGLRCIHLSPDNTCTIHDYKEYPEVCRNLTPSPEICGGNFREAMELLKDLEERTKPE